VAAAYQPYSQLAQRLVWLAGKPWLRRLIVDGLIAHPPWFQGALEAALTR